MFAIDVSLLDGLPLLHPGYVRVTDDVFEWRGERPEGGWHVHGWLDVGRLLIGGGGLRPVIVRKRRWQRVGRAGTCHSRPPDDLGSRYDALFVAVELLSWLSALVGVHAYDAPFDAGPDRRTVQRWLRRALPNALWTHHAVRSVLIEKCEPRPVELLSPGGLPPPFLNRSGWRDPGRTSTLFRALAMLKIGARDCIEQTALLLAEARGRFADPHHNVLM